MNRSLNSSNKQGFRLRQEVLVRKGRGSPFYVCRKDHNGWKCGKCLRGNLGFIVKLRRKCKVCGAIVREIEWLE